MTAPSRRLFVLALTLAAMAVGSVTAHAAGKKRLLFYTRSAGYEHSVIKETDGKPSHAENVLRPICEAHGWELVVTKDGSLFTPEFVAGFDAFALYTTGRLTAPNSKDGGKPMTPEGKAAFLKAIHDGKGYIGFHSASDTCHSGPRYVTQPMDQRDPYIVMLGGEFIKHGAQQDPIIHIVDPKFPGAAACAPQFKMKEEWYSLKNFANDLHVVAVIDTEGMRGNVYQRPPYPMAWARTYGQGRVYYTAMGHREDVWTSDQFKSLMVGGLQWVFREVDADVTPNISKVTPHADVIPPQDPPKKK